jgi:hypothetical protein
MAVEEAVNIIEMTPAHLACLNKSFPDDRHLFLAIYQQRKRTLEYFVKAYMDNYRLGAMEEAANREAAAAYKAGYKVAHSNTAAGQSTAEPK